jgi:NAD-dependent SIR2 family protein deacetylase
MIENRRKEERMRCSGCGKQLRYEDVRVIRHFTEGYTVEVCDLCGLELTIYPL